MWTSCGGPTLKPLLKFLSTRFRVIFRDVNMQVLVCQEQTLVCEARNDYMPVPTTHTPTLSLTLLTTTTPLTLIRFKIKLCISQNGTSKLRKVGQQLLPTPQEQLRNNWLAGECRCQLVTLHLHQTIGAFLLLHQTSSGLFDSWDYSQDYSI